MNEVFMLMEHEDILIHSFSNADDRLRRFDDRLETILHWISNDFTSMDQSWAEFSLRTRPNSIILFKSPGSGVLFTARRVLSWRDNSC